MSLVDKHPTLGKCYLVAGILALLVMGSYYGVETWNAWKRRPRRYEPD